MNTRGGFNALYAAFDVCDFEDYTNFIRSLMLTNYWDGN
jgi:hypothetical protein